MCLQSERWDQMKQTRCGANLNIIRHKISCCMKYCKHLSPSILSVVNTGVFFPIVKQMNMCRLIRRVKQQAGSTAELSSIWLLAFELWVWEKYNKIVSTALFSYNFSIYPKIPFSSLTGWRIFFFILFLNKHLSSLEKSHQWAAEKESSEFFWL